MKSSMMRFNDECGRRFGAAALVTMLGACLSMNNAQADVTITAVGWTTASAAVTKNLTNIGTNDWVIWSSTQSPASTPVVERKAGGNRIGNLGWVNAASTDFNGAVWNTMATYSSYFNFSFSDPAGVTASPVTSEAATFRRWYGDIWGSEARFTVPVATYPQTLEIYAAGLNGSYIQIRASFDNGATWTTGNNGYGWHGSDPGSRGTFRLAFSHGTATTMLVGLTQDSRVYGHSSNYLLIGGATLSGDAPPPRGTVILFR
jgi:hypothetical protein